jgi:hypothetical protein
MEETVSVRLKMFGFFIPFLFLITAGCNTNNSYSKDEDIQNDSVTDEDLQNSPETDQEKPDKTENDCPEECPHADDNCGQYEVCENSLVNQRCVHIFDDCGCWEANDSYEYSCPEGEVCFIDDEWGPGDDSRSQCAKLPETPDSDNDSLPELYEEIPDQDNNEDSSFIAGEYKCINNVLWVYFSAPDREKGWIKFRDCISQEQCENYTIDCQEH